MSFKIRPAFESDCEDIFCMIKELAIFENLEHQVTITTEVLKKDGFGKHKFFECFVAEHYDNVTGSCNAAGYAAYFFTYSTFEGKVLFVDDIYVKPEYRGQGVGTQLWKSIAEVALSHDCNYAQFVVLNWNNPSISFHKRMGAMDITELEKWHLFRFEKPDLIKFVAGHKKISI